MGRDPTPSRYIHLEVVSTAARGGLIKELPLILPFLPMAVQREKSASRRGEGILDIWPRSNSRIETTISRDVATGHPVGYLRTSTPVQPQRLV